MPNTEACVTALVIITWPVRRERLDEFWDLMLQERDIMVRLGGIPTRYFESNPNPYLQKTTGEDGGADPVVITGLFEYSSVDAWREMEEKLVGDPEFQQIGAIWQERRDTVLASESSVVLHTELNATNHPSTH